MGVMRLVPPFATVFSTVCFVSGSCSKIPRGEPAIAHRMFQGLTRTQALIGVFEVGQPSTGLGSLRASWM